MTSYFSSDYNAVNLLRNGGLDFVKPGSAEIPFWTIEGAALNAVPPNNSFSVVVKQTQESEAGAARYFRFLLSSDDPVVLIQEFSDRFIQMAFVETMGQDYLDSERLQDEARVMDLPELTYPSVDCLFVRGIPITAAFSIRVPQGRASLKMAVSPGTGSDIETDIRNRITTEDWIRITKAVDYGYRRVRRVKIVLTRDPGAGSTEVHIGAFMMAPGASSSLPYTGDPMADAFPENMIVFAFGDACPPGFEKMSFTAPPETGRVFPKGGAYAGDTVVGEETHDHEDARVVMNPERNWPTVEMIPSATEGRPSGDDGSTSHSHPKETALHVPPTKDVIFCKRISWNQGA